MGLGESREAAFALRDSVPAGTYRMVCDAIITAPVDVTLTLIWRRGDTDTTLAQWTSHWEPNGTFKAQACEVEMAAQAIDYRSGDLFVFRYHGESQMNAQAFIPNGDGERTDGRKPHIRLP